MTKKRSGTRDQIIHRLAEGHKLLASGRDLEAVCRHLEIAASTRSSTASPVEFARRRAVEADHQPAFPANGRGCGDAQWLRSSIAISSRFLAFEMCVVAGRHWTSLMRCTSLVPGSVWLPWPDVAVAGPRKVKVWVLAVWATSWNAPQVTQ